MAKKLAVQPRRVNVSQEVRADTSGEPRVAPKSLPIKTAVVDTAGERREED